MRPFSVLLTVWLITGVCTVLGSLVGRLGGRFSLFAGAIVGAIVGAIIGVVAAVALVSRVGWLPRSDMRGASLGAIGGFIVAVAVFFLGPNIESRRLPTSSATSATCCSDGCARQSRFAAAGVGVQPESGCSARNSEIAASTSLRRVTNAR